jgi:hypothetical protein
MDISNQFSFLPMSKWKMIRWLAQAKAKSVFSFIAESSIIRLNFLAPAARKAIALAESYGKKPPPKREKANATLTMFSST